MNFVKASATWLPFHYKKIFCRSTRWNTNYLPLNKWLPGCIWLAEFMTISYSLLILFFLVATRLQCWNLHNQLNILLIDRLLINLVLAVYSSFMVSNNKTFSRYISSIIPGSIYIGFDPILRKREPAIRFLVASSWAHVANLDPMILVTYHNKSWKNNVAQLRIGLDYFTILDITLSLWLHMLQAIPIISFHNRVFKQVFISLLFQSNTKGGISIDWHWTVLQYFYAIYPLSSACIYFNKLPISLV